MLNQVATQTHTEKGHDDLKSDIEKGPAQIENFQVDLETAIEKFRVDLLVKIETFKWDLIRWLFGFWVTLFVAILALFLKLPA